MRMKVFSLMIILFVSRSMTQNEGESCYHNYKSGICANIKICQSAIEDLKTNTELQVCSFNGVEPVVCCFDDRTTLLALIESSRITTTTTEAVEVVTNSSISDYISDLNGICLISSLFVPVQRTGKKALDKCIQYQELLVFPCEIRVPETGELTRGNRCYHDDKEFTEGTVHPTENDFLHMVLLGNDEDFYCGGTLISDRFVMTAAHCTNHPLNGFVKYVAVGIFRRKDTQNPTYRYDIENIILHPEYHPPSKYNDIALIETEKLILLNQFVVPACLDDGGSLEHTTAAATGLGITGRYGERAVELKKSVVSLMTKDECLKAYPSYRLLKDGILDTQTCYMKRRSTNICQGDSGGPVQVKSKKISCMYVVVGIISFGKQCGPENDTTVTTRVSEYLPWIESVVWPN